MAGGGWSLAWATLTSTAALNFGGPLRVDASGGFEFDLKTGRARAEGVVLHRGALRICCDRATLRLARGEVRGLSCIGRVGVFRADEHLARADRASVDADRGALILHGRVAMQLGGGVLRGPRIAYDAERSTVRTSGGRARFTRVERLKPWPSACPRGDSPR